MQKPGQIDELRNNRLLLTNRHHHRFINFKACRYRSEFAVQNQSAEFRLQNGAAESFAVVTNNFIAALSINYHCSNMTDKIEDAIFSITKVMGYPVILGEFNNRLDERPDP